MDFIGSGGGVPSINPPKSIYAIPTRGGAGDGLHENAESNPISQIYFEKRPWGNFTQYTHDQPSTVKIIEVKGGEILSLQLHHHRDELWVALDEGIIAESAGERHFLKPMQTLFVPRETLHRLSASKTARVLEIAFGKFDENDIVRFEDKYGRDKVKRGKELKNKK
jgi:mannose-1-phosphate guanylyltransferase/mannose-6-phosphate isomerase